MSVSSTKILSLIEFRDTETKEFLEAHICIWSGLAEPDRIEIPDGFAAMLSFSSKTGKLQVKLVPAVDENDE